MSILSGAGRSSFVRTLQCCSAYIYWVLAGCCARCWNQADRKEETEHSTQASDFSSWVWSGPLMAGEDWRVCLSQVEI